MPSQPQVCQLTAPAQPETLNVIHDSLARLWQRDPSVDPADRMRFEGAVIEIAGNIVEHSVVPPGLSHVTITLTMTCLPDEITAHFQDDGAPADIDPRALSEDAMPDWDAEAGRGLPLARAMTDRLAHTGTTEGNVWELACARGGGA